MEEQDLGINFGPWGNVMLAAASLGLVASALVTRTRTEDNALLPLSLSLICAFLAVPIALRYCHRILLEWSQALPSFVSFEDDSVASTMQKELEFFRGSKLVYVSGLAFGLMVTALIRQHIFRDYYPHASSPALIVATVVVFVSQSFAGVALITLFRGARVIWDFGNRSDYRLRVDRHRFGILSTGGVLLKCWGVAAMVWCVYQIPIIITARLKGLHEAILAPPVLVLTIPAIATIILTFVVCQYPLHHKMLDAKRAEILRINTLLTPLTLSTPDSISDDFIRKTQFLQGQLALAQTLPEWPFTRRHLFGTALSAAVSTSLAILVSEVVKQVLNAAIG